MIHEDDDATGSVDQVHRWGRIRVLDDGHETLLEEPHWGHNSEGQPIAWVDSAPDDW
ncbi:hypothetical protein ACFYO2_47370 [Streptomyces sp. NPDC006602]|uniref:hypothetical protein n=1 Tax=Streptomyces sp. NPDC006602 TaxID=3364751 RepID=UPI0036A2FC08